LPTTGRPNSQRAFTVRPSSPISSRTVAASGRIQPLASASKNGMRRFAVSPLLAAERCARSTAGSLRNQSGGRDLAGTGGAITPSSSGRQVKVMIGSLRMAGQRAAAGAYSRPGALRPCALAATRPA
jgi:hypothetical protein